MRRVPIRMKLAGALAVPLVALVVVTALEVFRSADDARQVRDQTTLAETSVGPSSLLSRLEDERNAAAVYMLGQEKTFALPVEDNQEARDFTDAALSDFRSTAASRGGEIEAAYGPGLEAMDGLRALRDKIDAYKGTRDLANVDGAVEIFDGYSELMTPMFDANKQVALAIDDPDLRRGAELVDLSSHQTDLIAILVRDLLLGAVSGDGKIRSPAEISNVARRLGQLRNNEALISTKATGTYRPLAQALFAAPEIKRFPQVVDEALTTGNVDLDAVITNSAGDDPDTYGYTVFRHAVTDELTRQADHLESAASARERWYLLLAGLAVAAAVVITWLVSRSITRPLRSLTGQATVMADRRLPEAVLDILDTPLGEDVDVPRVDAVAVQTRDEVSDVADALNTVQDTALDLAVEQAVLRRNIADSFVNLGRRNQNLLGRQLDFITELESHETDPDTLANLFRLDHLATRMRRNAESLLVLAGIEPPRKWAAPVRLTDVIRAALGEVEDYQRVTVRGVEPATIVGAAAADLAHLLAELIENALVFSPPDQTVDIRGRFRPGAGQHGQPALPAPNGQSRSGTGDRPGMYTLAIIDSGLGMTSSDVDAANRRLAGAESFTIAPSKYLGHYVAGNLAARHDIGVHLDNSPGNGITATVNIPPGLLTTEAVTAPPVTPPHGMRGVAAARGAGARALSPPPPGPVPAPLASVPQPGGWPPASPPVGTPRVGGNAVHAWPNSGDPADAPLAPPAASPAASPGSPEYGPAPQQPAARSVWPQNLTEPGATPGGVPGAVPPARGPNFRDPPWLTASPPSHAARTPSGLVKRSPRPATGPDVGPSTAPTDDLLASLSRYTRRGGTGEHVALPDRGLTPPGAGASRGAPRGPMPTYQPPPSAPFVPMPHPAVPPRPAPADIPPAPRLTRRVRGAQMPTTEPFAVRRATRDAPQPRRASQLPSDVRQSANDVYSFLSSFTAGVQRGLDEVRPRDDNTRN